MTITSKKLQKVFDQIESLVETYFEEKTEFCNFEKYEELPEKFRCYVKDSLSTIKIELEYLDNEIDSEIDSMNEERDYLCACKRAGIRPGEDI